ncbi:hypothetical protein R6Q59_035148 [Mikania micrantha]
MEKATNISKKRYGPSFYFIRDYYNVNDLSKQQKKAIIDMGFKAFLSLVVDTIPTRLARGLVSNYDCERDELNAGNQIIKVTTITVKDVLGVPLGKIIVNKKNKPRTESSDTLNTWKEQYHGKSRIKVKDVLDQMKKKGENGYYLFKLNWLVVYNTVLGWTTKSTTVNQRFLNSIRKEVDIPNINWCEYLITCLKRTKKEWNVEEPFNDYEKDDNGQDGCEHDVDDDDGHQDVDEDEESITEGANNEELINRKKKWDEIVNVISTLATREKNIVESDHVQQECQLDDVTSTFVQVMVQVCDHVEISRSLSKAVNPESENDNSNVDFAAKIETVITTVSFLQLGSIEKANQ